MKVRKTMETKTTSDKVCLETCWRSINKNGEELCGDRVIVTSGKEGTLLVLSDGLGSGVKANILSTLTSTIITTMIKDGASIEDTVDTIAHTLPVVKEKGLAYSTFMILAVSCGGEALLTEYDNPHCILIRGGEPVEINYSEKTISGKLLSESRFDVRPDDVLAIVSDGVSQAGMGETLAFGWGEDAVAQYIAGLCSRRMTPPRMVNNILGECSGLYLGRAGDDTTVSMVHVLPHQAVAIFSGPPKDHVNDSKIVADFMNVSGLHVISGGTSAEIAARELGRELKVQQSEAGSDMPPTSSIEGIDLVTEGVITLKNVLDLINEYMKNPVSEQILDKLDGQDGAARMAKMLIVRCTDLRIFAGRAVNPAHQDADFPVELRQKWRVLTDLNSAMAKLGRSSSIKYY